MFMPPTTPAPRARFLALLAENITRGTFEKLTLGKPRQPAADPALQNVFVRPIALKSGPHLSFVWRHATRDVTKNFPTAEAVAHIETLLGPTFLDAHLFTATLTANAGLPATSGFIGEFMVILGAVKFNFWIGMAAATALILGAAYSLWLVKRVIFGEVRNPHVATMEDLTMREFFMLGVLAVAVLWMGVYPAPFTDAMQTSVSDLLQHVEISKIPQ